MKKFFAIILLLAFIGPGIKAAAGIFIALVIISLLK